MHSATASVVERDWQKNRLLQPRATCAASLAICCQIGLMYDLQLTSCGFFRRIDDHAGALGSSLEPHEDRFWIADRGAEAYTLNVVSRQASDPLQDTHQVGPPILSPRWRGSHR